MSAPAGALLGLICAAGLLLVVSGVMAHRRPRLAARIARSSRPGLADRGPWGAFAEVFGPGLTRVTRRWGGGGHASLPQRLASAGRAPDVHRHQLERIAWASGGGIAGVVLTLMVFAQRPQTSPVLAILLICLAAGGALLLHDHVLNTAIRKRGRRMSEQLPTVAELLAFAVSAGEAPLAAMERVATTVAGDLAAEMRGVVGSVRGGTPYLIALRQMAERCPSTDVARFVDGIVVATERGTPIADVLRAQAGDARAAGRRALMEAAGKKEILMLAPVVFFVLPIVVVIADGRRKSWHFRHGVGTRLAPRHLFGTFLRVESKYLAADWRAETCRRCMARGGASKGVRWLATIARPSEPSINSRAEVASRRSLGPSPVALAPDGTGCGQTYGGA